jgi:hypothetical protein
MGEAQRLGSDEQIRFAREGFDGGQDFTVAVEEEFAILDPRTHELVNRFEELFEAAQGHRARRQPGRRVDRLRGRDPNRAL